MDCVDVPSFTSAFNPALIPAIFGTENEKLIGIKKVGQFLMPCLCLTHILPNRNRRALKFLSYLKFFTLIGATFLAHQPPTYGDCWADFSQLNSFKSTNLLNMATSKRCKKVSIVASKVYFVMQC